MDHSRALAPLRCTNGSIRAIWAALGAGNMGSVCAACGELSGTTTESVLVNAVITVLPSQCKGGEHRDGYKTA